MSDIFQLAENALQTILDTPKHAVYASRTGIVAGLNIKGESKVLVFRRVNKVARFEIRMHTYHLLPEGVEHIAIYDLPPYLERRASVMLDNL